MLYKKRFTPASQSEVGEYWCH